MPRRPIYKVEIQKLVGHHPKGMEIEMLIRGLGIKNNIERIHNLKAIIETGGRAMAVLDHDQSQKFWKLIRFYKSFDVAIYRTMPQQADQYMMHINLRHPKEKPVKPKSQMDEKEKLDAKLKRNVLRRQGMKQQPNL